MEDYTYIEILVEDKSGSILLEQVMKKYVFDRDDISYNIHGFKGLGKLPRNLKDQTQVKTNRLLTDLPLYLSGINKSLQNMPGKKAIFVVLDSDDQDCEKLKKDLVQMSQKLGLTVQVFFCIAIEEMEAWLLGDSMAIQKAFVAINRTALQKYVQDSIVGTWECLANVVYKGGVQKLKKMAVSYFEIGQFKCECAEKIGQEMDIRKNESPSFNYFINKLDSFCSNT